MMAYPTIAITHMNVNMSIFTRPQQPSCCFSCKVLTPFTSQGLRHFPHRSVAHLSKSNIKKWRHSMLVSTRPVLQEGTLSFEGKKAFTGVPDNVFVIPLTDTSGFLGATSTESSSWHVFKLGVIRNARLLCLFRFKLWWMIPRVGDSGSDIPIETQMLLMEVTQRAALDAPTSSSPYVVFLPVLDGDFRSSFQGNSSNEIELCIEVFVD